VPSENSGRTINDITYLKDSVRLKVADKVFNLTHEAFTDHYLYIGKELTPTELGAIDDASSLYKHEKYAFRLLAKGLYTTAQVKTKLYAREAKGWMVRAIIDKLNQSRLINDELFISERLEYGHARNEGFYRIIEDLRQKGIDETKLAEIHYDDEQELQKASALYPRVWEAQKRKSRRAGVQAVYEWYFRHGFPDVIIHKMVTKAEGEESDDRPRLRQDYETAKRKYGLKYKGKALRERMIGYLRQKGYNYGDIVVIMGEQEHDMD